ncbi:MAG: BlaI/MecI/CopY family transcriptional regulator [Oscillospiraceae bacterium]|nr:BlaI/MecI/CopY family transcriptional regulator [Oscillospiraceae bacterium]
MRRLPDTELEMMLVLWEAEEEVPRSYFDQRLKEKNWSINTINTYLSRLEKKGFLSCEKRGKMNFYRPAVGREEYLAFESRSVLDRLYGSSVKRFVTALYQDKRLDEDQLGELEELLEELKRRD